jgi:TolA-binding protein
MKETFLSIAIALAPFQCGGGNEPQLEETAGDALWNLAEDFEARGEHASAQHTLKVLVERYPSSRHADAARRKLDAKPDAG